MCAGAGLDSATLWCVSDLAQLSLPTHYTKQVLTNQTKRMFALLTFCKRLRCNRQRWRSFGLRAVRLTDEILTKHSAALWLLSADMVWGINSHFFLILTSFVLRWCFSLTHQHLQENEEVNNRTAVFPLYSDGAVSLKGKSVLWWEIMKMSMRIALRQLFAHFLPHKCKCVSSIVRDWELWACTYHCVDETKVEKQGCSRQHKYRNRQHN